MKKCSLFYLGSIVEIYPTSCWFSNDTRECAAALPVVNLTSLTLREASKIEIHTDEDGNFSTILSDSIEIDGGSAITADGTGYKG